MDKENLIEIVKNRANPGILIFDLNNKLRYSNKEAVEILPEISFIKDFNVKSKQNFLKEIQNICNIAKTEIKSGKTLTPDNPLCKLLRNKKGSFFSVRAFCLGLHLDNKPSHIMVLIENIVEKRPVNYSNISKKFGLTKRETEVLKLICNGLSNKDISKSLIISEYTVKDHIKNIMQKMNASSRSEIISLVI